MIQNYTKTDLKMMALARYCIDTFGCSTSDFCCAYNQITLNYATASHKTLEELKVEVDVLKAEADAL